MTAGRRKIRCEGDDGIRPRSYAGGMSDDFRSDETRIRMSWGVGIALGMGVGVAIGAAMDNMAMGIAVGIAVGVVFAVIVGRLGRGRSGSRGRGPEQGYSDGGDGDGI